MIEVKETTLKDIDNVQRLWADGDVMRLLDFLTDCTKQAKKCKDGFGGLNPADLS